MSGSLSERTLKMLHKHLCSVACQYWALGFTHLCMFSICIENINGSSRPNAGDDPNAELSHLYADLAEFM